MRNVLSFNDNWSFIKKATDAKDAVNSTGEAITLPHTWNAIDGQDGGNDYHRGVCWYVKEFEKPETNPTDRVYIEFLGAAMTAEVYLNGEKLSHHEGGYSTFRVDLTDSLKESNKLVVSLENEDNETVYPQKADFTFYGGLYRSVNLIIVPESHFALDYCGTPGIKVTPVVDLEKKRAEVTVEAWINGTADKVVFTVGNESIESAVVDGYAKSIFTMEQVHLWDGVHDPFLYIATASLESGDSVSTRFGCRHFEIDPQKGFILNGRTYLLRGVSRHQDMKGVGNALTLDMQKK